MPRVKRNIYYTQAYSAWLCVQVGITGYFFGSNARGRGVRLELFTPYRRFRLSHSWIIRVRRWWRKVRNG